MRCIRNLENHSIPMLIVVSFLPVSAVRMTTRASLTNRGSNLMSAMNQMHENPAAVSTAETTAAAGDKATDATALLNEPHSTNLVDPVKSRTSKLILIVASVLCLAAVVALIAILVTRKNDTDTPVEEIIPCSFTAPFLNWVNYGLNNTGIMCPTTGMAYNCIFDAQCLTINPLCLPGTPSALSCMQGVCSVASYAMPTMLHAGGVCNRSSERPTCAVCTSGACLGIALCVKSEDCSSTKLTYGLECHSDGHQAN